MSAPFSNINVAAAYRNKWQLSLLVTLAERKYFFTKSDNAFGIIGLPFFVRN